MNFNHLSNIVTIYSNIISNYKYRDLPSGNEESYDNDRNL